MNAQEEKGIVSTPKSASKKYEIVTDKSTGNRLVIKIDGYIKAIFTPDTEVEVLEIHTNEIYFAIHKDGKYVGSLYL